MPLLSDTRVKDEQVRGDQQREHDGPRTLALAVPAQGAIAVLAVAWNHELSAAEVDAYRHALSYILQLTAAALGKIEAHSSLERHVCDQHEQLANTSVAHAAELARRDEAEAKMRMLSVTDVLTGLYNRRGFFLQAEQIYKLAQRKRTQSAVIFADIDGLKRVNMNWATELAIACYRTQRAYFANPFAMPMYWPVSVATSSSPTRWTTSSRASSCNAFRPTCAPSI